MVRQEFQPVILAAGTGFRLAELTARKPKCLLPIGGKPMVWYPLFKLRNSGFTDVILIVNEDQKLEIQNALDRLELDVKIEYVAIPPNNDFGTADSLRFLNKLTITSDLLVLPCDLVSDASLIRVIDLYRKHEASICVLLFQPQEPEEKLSVPGPKSKIKPEKDIFGLDPKTNRIIFLASASDFDVPLKRAMLQKHRQILAYSNLVDSHVYILKNWILKYLKQEESISSIRGELLPHIIKLYKQKKGSDAAAVGAEDRSDIFQFAEESDVCRLIRNSATFNDHSGDLKAAYHGDTIRCYAHVASKGVFGLRTNTLRNYWLMNREVVGRWPKLTGGRADLVRVDPRAEVRSSQVDDGCIVWESAKLAERTSFKNAIVGSNTAVASFSTVFNSVVMNGVTIREKVALDGCIVCDGATIESGSQLRGCIVLGNYNVAKNSRKCDEVLSDTDTE